MTELVDRWTPCGSSCRALLAKGVVGSSVVLAMWVTGCKSSAPETSKPANAPRGAVLSNAAAPGPSGARPRPQKSAAAPSDPPVDPADPLGLKLRIDGRETNGQVMLTIFRAMCNRVVECGLPKPIESCMIDALEASCKDIRCDAPFAEDRREYSECARAYATFACDKALAGVMPPTCPGED
jgi:hypothetical protein